MAGDKSFKLHFQRFEFKYQVPLDFVDGIIPELLKYMEFDSYAKLAKDNLYDVASLYFDTAGYGCYFDKIDGQKTRKKLRVRFYDFKLNPDTPVFLEIKRKYDNVVIKDRINLDYETYHKMVELGESRNLVFAGQNEETFSEFFWLKDSNGMRPQNVVVYSRKALISKVDPGFRVTIDTNIRTHQANFLRDFGIDQTVFPGVAIIEVKFNNVMPFWFHDIITTYGLEQRPFSKYCNSLEVCYPQLAVGNPVIENNPSLSQLIINS
ncbi:MAG: polyphosphate polymerase domain-containing protein [Patescibacteria group bacterium]|nr:polyphosphate polymerase domain-containing protein [Patescibacteria group bacterium]